ncbi:MAG: hypothetical protein EXQ89_05120 [Rhodospirillaceae bacterium]|nr:hypothetical protein [Rhodospirillaceae bacterium]
MSYRRRGGAAIVVAGAVAILFGLATIFSGGQALFGDEAAQKAAGDAVPFVLWFNFGAGFAYVLTGGGLLLRRKWAVGLSALIAAATGLVFLAFGIHVLFGGDYELRTVGAMSLRILVWTGIAAIAARAARRRRWA